MDNLLDVLKNAESALAQKLEKLDELEKEKKDLLDKGKNVDKKEVLNYEKKLIESEIKYTNLLEEVQELSKKIKYLKSKF